MENRIRKVIDYYGLKPYSFEQKISVSEGTIRKFLTGEIGMKVDTLAKISANFPDVSIDWLLLGKGEMLREKCENVGGEGREFVKIPTDVWEAMQMQTASLKAKDEQISRLIEMLSGNRGGGQPVEATVEG